MTKSNQKPTLSMLFKTLVGLGISSLLLSGCSTNQSLSTAASSERLTIKSVDPKDPLKSKNKVDVTPDKLASEITRPVHHNNVWDEMRSKFDLADEYYGNYEKYLRFYNDRKTHLKKVSERAEPYLFYILTEVKKRNMPYEIALLPAVESGFRPLARSHQRAVGLWQFIPGTAELYDLDRNWWYDGRKDVIQSTTAALDYLEKLYKHNNNDWLLALASYNAGLGNVYRAQRKYRKEHKNQPGIEEYQPNYWEILPYLPKETQGYVPKLLAVAHIIEYAEKFEMELKPIHNKPYFSVFTLEKQISLNQVSMLSNTPMELLASLNPGYHQPATPPNGPHHLLLPVKSADSFAETLKTDKSLFTIQWQKHKIQSGDSLSVIAQKYNTSSRAIQKLNGMKNARIRAGKTLLIPIPADKSDSVLAKLSSNIQLASQNTKNDVSKQSHKPEQSHKKIHIVKQGDSLWEIAKNHNTSMKNIAAWNNLNLKTNLKLGQKLAIYTPKRNETKGQKIEHTLKKGESLWVLAKRYKVSTQAIAQWNEISKNKLLKPGMKLIIWSRTSNNSNNQYIVKNGDNLWDIAKANQISATELAKHNKLSLKTLLQPGQVLQIPIEES